MSFECLIRNWHAYLGKQTTESEMTTKEACHSVFNIVTGTPQVRKQFTEREVTTKQSCYSMSDPTVYGT